MKNKSFFCLRNVIILFLVFMCLYYLISYSPLGTSKLREISGGHTILDMEFTGYSADKAHEVLGNLGEAGRAFDLNLIVPIDFVFPLAYGMLFFTTLSLIAKNISNIKKPWLFGLIGFAAAAFDYAENILKISLLQSYPHLDNGTVAAASICTQIKGVLIILCFALIAAGLLILIIKKLIAKHSKQAVKN